MRLKTISGEGFFSFRKKFSYGIDGRGLVLVVGDNGAGKSALLIESILWTLYGETIREKVSPAEWKSDDVICNSAIKKGCFVEVSFSVDGTEYSVLRARKHHEHGTGVVLREHVTGGDIRSLSGESIRETNAQICRLVGMNFESFTHSVIFAQNFKRFTQCTDAERRAILEEFQQTQVFVEARKRAVERHREAQNVVSEADRRLAKCEGARDTLENQKNELTEEYEGEQERAATEQAQRKIAIKKNAENVKIISAQLAEIKKEYKVATDLVNTYSADVLSVGEIAKLRRELGELSGEVRSQSDTVRRETNSMREVSRRAETWDVGDECPECLREMTEEDVEDYQKIMLKDLIKHRKAIKTAEREIAKLAKQKQALDIRIESNEKAAVKYDNASNEVIRIERQQVKLESTLSSLESEAARLKIETDNLSATLKKHEAQIARIEKEQKQNEAEIKKILKEIAAGEKEVSRLKFWVDGFGTYGIKEFIFRRSLDYLNDRLAYFAGRLTGGEMQVSLIINDKGKIEPIVEIRNGASKYVGASGGQEKRIDLCISLALQTLVEAGSASCNIAVFDEFDGALDQAGLYMFIDFLKQEAEKKGSVFVITHNSDLKTQFDNVLKIEGGDDGSRIAEGNE